MWSCYVREPEHPFSTEGKRKTKSLRAMNVRDHRLLLLLDPRRYGTCAVPGIVHSCPDRSRGQERFKLMPLRDTCSFTLQLLSLNSFVLSRQYHPSFGRTRTTHETHVSPRRQDLINSSQSYRCTTPVSFRHGNLHFLAWEKMNVNFLRR